jgi:DNA-binding LytR/AlgR family response regulator
MSIKTFLLDDEPLAVAELNSMLKLHKEVEVVGSANDPHKALEFLKKNEVDLLFLDINMPGMNGFQFLETMDEVPEVIFVTAYDQYAIKAFEINALDYLLKPLSQDRLQEGLQKALQRLGSEKPAASTLIKEFLSKMAKPVTLCLYLRSNGLRALAIMCGFITAKASQCSTDHSIIWKNACRLTSFLGPIDKPFSM